MSTTRWTCRTGYDSPLCRSLSGLERSIVPNNKETASWKCSICGVVVRAEPKDLDTAIYVHQLSHQRDPK